MLFESFEELYLLLRANYYRRVAAEVGTRKGSLSATECFCLEIILLMDRPTLSEFSAFLSISLPSANYRVNSLIEKGYLARVASAQDKRETLLEVTPRYKDFYGGSNPEVHALIHRIEKDFSPEDLAALVRMIDRIIILLRQARQTGETDE